MLRSSLMRREASSFFQSVKLGPADPILGLGLAFNADKDPNKVNLGVGVYRGDDGKPFVLESVKKAGGLYPHMEYAPISGAPGFVSKAQALAFGDNSTGIKDKRIASTQSLSGTGGLRVVSDFLARFLPSKKIYVPNPTWGNHLNIFKDSGLDVQRYSYYDASKNALNIEGLLKDLNAAPKDSIVLLHACAHNPTGIDPTKEQWAEIINLVSTRKLFPFVDMAYQGFASGDLDRDAYALRALTETVPNLALAQSFAKNFGLYGQRVGAAHFLCKDADEAERVLSQVKILIRPMYSNPPIHGAHIVDTILSSPELTKLWRGELKAMADRMNNIRGTLVQELASLGSTRNWSHITNQIGMMAFTGLSKAQVDRLKAEFHVYMTDDGRAAISGLNSGNVKYVAKAFHEVTK